MTATTELDRAIWAARNATRDAYNMATEPDEFREADVKYAQALIAELLRGMEEEIQGGHSAEMLQFDQGYVSALDEIRLRAGLEGEG